MFLVQELSKNFWLSFHHPPPNKISQKIILKKLGILHGSVKDVPNSTQSCILQSELKEPLWSKFVLPAYLGFPAKKEKLFRENFAWSLHFLRSQKNAKKNLFIRKISLQSVSRKNAKFSQNIKCENFAKK